MFFRYLLARPLVVHRKFSYNMSAKTFSTGKINPNNNKVNYQGIAVIGVIFMLALYDSSLYQGDRFMNVLWRQGQGSATYANGTTYTGNWSGNTRYGDGNLICASGITYSGSWRFNRLQGGGCILYPDGSKYRGDLKIKRDINHWIPEGDGELIGRDYHYEGDFLAGKFDGFGVLTTYGKSMLDEHGNKIATKVYHGHFKAGQMNGEGTLKVYNSSDCLHYTIYEGCFVDGKREGLFTTKNECGAVLHAGRWRHDMPV